MTKIIQCSHEATEAYKKEKVEMLSAREDHGCLAFVLPPRLSVRDIKPGTDSYNTET